MKKFWDRILKNALLLYCAYQSKEPVCKCASCYIPTLLLVLGYLWLSGLREPLAESIPGYFY